MNLRYDHYTTQYPGQSLANHLQDISLRINYDDHWDPIIAQNIACLQRLRKFTGSHIPRKSCAVLFETPWAARQYFGLKVIGTVNLSTGVKKVACEIPKARHYMYWFRPASDTSLEVPSGSQDFDNILRGFKIVKKI